MTQDAIVPNGVVAIATTNIHAEAAQLRLEELRRWREQIPRFAIPETSDATKRLTPASLVSPVFIELTNVAVANQITLVRADATPAAEIRDLVAYADAYVTVADELEAEAFFGVRASFLARKKDLTLPLTLEKEA